MLVKLQWTAGNEKPLGTAFKVLSYLINYAASSGVIINSSSNQIQTFYDAYLNPTAVQFGSYAYNGFDITNSFIYKNSTSSPTLLSTKTSSQYFKNSATSYGWDFLVQQQAYDTTSLTKIIHVRSESTAGNGGLVRKCEHLTTIDPFTTYGNLSEAASTQYYSTATTTATDAQMAQALGVGNRLPLTQLVVTSLAAGGVLNISSPVAALSKDVGQGSLQTLQTNATWTNLINMPVTVTGSQTGVGVIATGVYYISAVTATTITLKSAPFEKTGAITTTAGSVPGYVFTLGAANIGQATAGSTIAGALENSVRTLWAYVTDTCFMWNITNTSAGSTLGIPASTNLTNTNWPGPFISSQYTRVDPWNTAANNIFPGVTTTGKAFYGFGDTTSAVTAQQNTEYTTSISVNSNSFELMDFRADTIVSAWQSTTATGFTKRFFWPVNIGVGNRFNESVALNASLSNGQTSSSVITTPSTYNPITYSDQGQALYTQVGYRYWNSDFTKMTFAMLPITFRNAYHNFVGGNISEKSGIYWFNGDYFPGDSFVYNNKTYIIMPAGIISNDTYRIGLAIPRE